ncbi:DevB family ABC exporter membrane fusion protein [Raphidiopsis curvata NIES-932]|nr:DevB family ABC exporter membrane fusion protein [Raphidiopsis curvata NIES-932]
MSRVSEKPKLTEQILESPIWLKIALAMPVAIAAGFLATARIEQLKKLASPTSISQTPNTITAVGRLEPRGEVIKIAAPNSGLSAGSRVQELLVKEGEKVQKGQIITILDSRDSNMAPVEEARAKLQESRANLAQVKSSSPRDIQTQNAVIYRLQAQLQGEEKTQQATIARIAAELSGQKLVQSATVKRLEAELIGQRDILRASVERVRAE